MNDNEPFLVKLCEQSRKIISELKSDPDIGNYIDESLSAPCPFEGTGEIRLIVIGQDPTVKDLVSRSQVKTVLTLDDPGSHLYRYVNRISTGLGFSLHQNVYATNVCKNFFTELPETVDDVDLIAVSWSRWKELLDIELSRYPDAIIVTLGKPILGVLVHPPASHDLKQYWGHVDHWKTKGRRDFQFVEKKDSIIGRRFFPFPHITNSKATELYSRHFDDYLEFVCLIIEKKAISLDNIMTNEGYLETTFAAPKDGDRSPSTRGR
jgi:uracil-DNA glycosylase